MRQKLLDALKTRFQSYDDLIESVESDHLGRKVDVPRHKSLIEHLWCVVGARESYARALDTGSWEGFACSMTKYTHAEISEKLRSSASAVLIAAEKVEDWTEERQNFLLDLSEHEVMHEGGIIRHMYAFETDMPGSVKWA